MWEIIFAVVMSVEALVLGFIFANYKLTKLKKEDSKFYVEEEI